MPFVRFDEPEGFPQAWRPTRMDDKDLADFIGVIQHSHLYLTGIQKHKLTRMTEVVIKREVKTDG